MMIVGIPNVGKSTFINNIAKRKATKIGNRPGVTKTNQWLKTDSNLLLLDTPGILWPKFESKETALNLSFTGAIKDEVLNLEEIAFNLIECLNKIDRSILIKRYDIEEKDTTIETMDAVAIRLGSISKGNEIDYSRVSKAILDDFRKTRLGRISLERVEDL